jgi:PII-like signaling protein
MAGSSLSLDTRSPVKVARRRSVSLKIVVAREACCGLYSASDAIVRAAHDMHLAQPIVTGVTGGYRRLFARLLGVEDVAPVVVEIIDARQKLEALARKVHHILPDAMISWEAVELWVPLEVIE